MATFRLEIILDERDGGPTGREVGEALCGAASHLSFLERPLDRDGIVLDRDGNGIGSWQITADREAGQTPDVRSRS
ncbi:MAG TPA: hypothetical protein VMF07_08140 [Solirubrobacteraceae bacterium]|nr:hypothetical protein [Solirubrobacteraceae bacterium]